MLLEDNKIQNLPQVLKGSKSDRCGRGRVTSALRKMSKCIKIKKIKKEHVRCHTRRGYNVKIVLLKLFKYYYKIFVLISFGNQIIF